MTLSIVLLSLLVISGLYYMLLEWQMQPLAIQYDGVYWQLRFSSIEPGRYERFFWCLKRGYERIWCRAGGKASLVYESAGAIARVRLQKERSCSHKAVLWLSFQAVTGERFHFDLWPDQLPASGFRRFFVVSRLG